MASGATENGHQNPDRKDDETSGDSEVTPQRPLLSSEGPGPKTDERDGDNRYRETDESNDHVASGVLVHENYYYTENSKVIAFVLPAGAASQANVPPISCSCNVLVGVRLRQAFCGS